MVAVVSMRMIVDAAAPVVLKMGQDDQYNGGDQQP